MVSNWPELTPLAVLDWHRTESPVQKGGGSASYGVGTVKSTQVCLGGAEKRRLPKLPKSSKAGHLTKATRPDFRVFILCLFSVVFTILT